MSDFTTNFMNPKQVEIIKNNLGIELDGERISRFQEWEKLFLEYNSTTNLMSKNEIGNLFEKHVYDSLSIVLTKAFQDLINNKKGGKLLDIGTGGGFPSAILAIAFPQITVTANDSRSRKTKFIEIVKENLGLQNLKILTERAENIPCENADIITFRAVGKIKDILPLAKIHANKGAHIIFYKAKGVKEETDEALRNNKNLKAPEIIPYSLPIDVEHTRNLVVFKL